MRSPYTCLYREIWNDEKFWELPESAQLVYVHLLSTPIGNGIGCYKAGLEMLAEDKRMDAKAYRKAFAEVLSNALIEYNEKHRVVWIPKYIERNEPGNPNVLKSWGRIFAVLPECDLKAKCFHAIKDYAEAKSEAFHKAFGEAFDKAYPKESGNMAPSPSLSGTLSGEGVDAGVPPAVPTPRKKAKKAKKVKRNTRAAKSTETWEAYSAAYCDRYGTDPVRNATTNALCCQLVDRLGATEAPLVAGWYVLSHNSYYERQGHSLKALVADAEKLRTEWATGKQVTAKLETPQQRERREQIEQAARWVREAEEEEKNDGNEILRVDGRADVHGGISEDDNDGGTKTALDAIARRDRK